MAEESLVCRGARPLRCYHRYVAWARRSGAVWHTRRVQVKRARSGAADITELFHELVEVPSTVGQRFVNCRHGAQGRNGVLPACAEEKGGSG